MADVFSKKKRSQVMSCIRSRGNKDTEVKLAKFFRRHKITGWRRQVRISGGAVSRRGPNIKAARQRRPASFRVRPDFVFPKHRLTVFVDGCFWHGCPKHGTKPKGNAAFWRKKFASNIARDRLVTRTLRRADWRVLRIWEHTLRWAAMKPQNEARLRRRIRWALIPAR